VYTLESGRGIKVIYIYIYIYTYYLIVVCIDGKKYVTNYYGTNIFGGCIRCPVYVTSFS
jgi:hypothetical protein